MNTTPATLSLFTRELELSSAGKSGRALMEAIAATGLPTLGASHPAALARALSEQTPELEILAGEYLAAAAIDSRLTSFVMVAASPTIATAIRRALGFLVDPEFDNELAVCLLECLAEVAEHPVELRRRWLAVTAVRRARAATRTKKVANCQMVGLEDARDVTELESSEPSLKVRLDALVEALDNGIISGLDAAIIKASRSGEMALADIAHEFGVSYFTLQKRRTRAEAKVIEFILAAEKTWLEGSRGQ